MLLLVTACSKSDDQKEFEDRAFSPPQNYTAMQANGQPASPAQSDPDDWRVSPMYSGLIDISTPAYPNPVNLNGSFRIDIDIKGIESIPGIQIYVLQQAQNLFGPITQIDQSSLNPGIRVLVLDPASFAGSGSTQNAVGLNRLVIFDSRNNVISYGDVKVE
ncbi:MAG: hypothetical protein R3281_15485 [Balneolaceae bacterium]|nr:hypothetical protein [Balneolaceae bacterium]